VTEWRRKSLCGSSSNKLLTNVLLIFQNPPHHLLDVSRRSHAPPSCATYVLLMLYLVSFPKHHIQHMKGVINIATDALSRPSTVAPSWASAVRIASPTLDKCKPYQVPRATYESFHSHFLGVDRGDVRESYTRIFLAAHSPKGTTMITSGQVIPLLAA
jgi:hypothetical protein